MCFGYPSPSAPASQPVYPSSNKGPLMGGRVSIAGDQDVKECGPTTSALSTACGRELIIKGDMSKVTVVVIPPPPPPIFLPPTPPSPLPPSTHLPTSNPPPPPPSSPCPFIPGAPERRSSLSLSWLGSEDYSRAGIERRAVPRDRGAYRPVSPRFVLDQRFFVHSSTVSVSLCERR